MRADDHRPALGDQHGAEENPAVLTDGDVSTDRCIGRNVSRLVDAWPYVLMFDLHSSIFFLLRHKDT
jgi:hypothetical protein